MEPTSNIPSTTKTCFKCNATFQSYLNSNAYSIICGKCGLVYTQYDGPLNKTTFAAKLPIKPLDIPLGTIGKIQGIRYQVIAYVKKFEYRTTYYWDEYTLFNPIHGIAYLSQYDGHWIYLTEISGFAPPAGLKVSFEKQDYDLYSRYQSKVHAAVGEFPFAFSPTETISVEEYIQPPFMVSKEYTTTNITWYKGEYLSPGSIKDAFSLKEIPDTEGVGMLQPYVGKFKTEGLRNLLVVLTLIWGIMQFYFSSASHEELVFSQTYQITDSLNRKEIYSKPFELKHGTANAEIKITTNIDNNWMYTAVTLVNEATGDLYDVDLEAEYYHGYEGGESWSEGKSWISKIVSQVPEGKYYLIIYPDKPTNMSFVNLGISVTRDVFVISNGLLVVLILGLFPAFYFYRKDSFEKKRWYNSNYSPYDED